MTDKEKIVEIIQGVDFYDSLLYRHCIDMATADKLADALIKAGFISLKTSSEWARESCDILRHIKDDEIKCIANEQRKHAVKEFAERVKMAFYYEFDELIPSIMADRIDELVKEVCGE